MDRYRVVVDYQGGEFGMGVNYTVEQWRKKALEWCYSDDNLELAEDLYKLPHEDVIDFIAELWTLGFRKVRKDKKNFDKHDLEDYEDGTLDEFFHARFDYMKELEEKENEYYESKTEFLLSEKENLMRTLEEGAEMISQAKEIVDWLLTHNKNYTKEQYNKLQELKDILEGE